MAEFNSEAALAFAHNRISEWAIQDGEISRAEAGAELAQILKDLVRKQEGGAISYKALNWILFEELLG